MPFPKQRIPENDYRRNRNLDPRKRDREEINSVIRYL